ncbi:MAG: hypothetical protein QXS76_00150 [Candidatus Bathyarchaeia archaeon]
MTHAEGCIKCGDRRVVSSISLSETGELLGWICKRCYDEIPLIEKATRYLFGSEGFVEEEKTVWDE